MEACNAWAKSHGVDARKHGVEFRASPLGGMGAFATKSINIFHSNGKRITGVAAFIIYEERTFTYACLTNERENVQAKVCTCWRRWRTCSPMMRKMITIE